MAKKGKLSKGPKAGAANRGQKKGQGALRPGPGPQNRQFGNCTSSCNLAIRQLKLSAVWLLTRFIEARR